VISLCPAAAAQNAQKANREALSRPATPPARASRQKSTTTKRAIFGLSFFVFIAEKDFMKYEIAARSSLVPCGVFLTPISHLPSPRNTQEHERDKTKNPSHTGIQLKFCRFSRQIFIRLLKGFDTSMGFCF
jgi:hypothetical protein